MTPFQFKHPVTVVRHVVSLRPYTRRYQYLGLSQQLCDLRPPYVFFRN